MVNTREQFEGFVSTGVGTSELVLILDEQATVRLTTRWMGQAPLDVTLHARHQVIGSRSGALFIIDATDGEGRAVPLPPSDGAIVLEYAKVDEPQPAIELVGISADAWSVLLWLHPNSYFDDGSDLPADQYECSPDAFAPVVRMLRELERPWKLR